MLYHFIEFLVHSPFSPSRVETPVSERKLPSRENIPDGTYAFRFFDQTRTLVNGELLTGPKKNFSPYTYLGGTLYSIEEVTDMLSEDSRMVQEMDRNGIKSVVKTEYGHWIPVRDGDKVLLLF